MKKFTMRDAKNVAKEFEAIVDEHDSAIYFDTTAGRTWNANGGHVITMSLYRDFNWKPQSDDIQDAIEQMRCGTGPCENPESCDHCNPVIE